MADATAADEEPDAPLLHAAAHDVDNSSENDSAALGRFFQFDDDGTVEVVAAVTALLGSDLVAPVAATSSQRRPNVERGALEAGVRLARDYFDDVRVYSAETFRRRFRMQQHLFLRVVRATA
ncbi:hypothetical protein PR003_g9946 [Phytophthora rubi]|uniref:Uncharacterized protein n=1 Tax=Phytophthora rubi TaxID=129364 RepID=A0A6A4FLK5_9STRA|nr:hypothetical protein PR002_g9718 [Phytophthora rubi]KAE9035289.1 hypothetical protein PR001_g9373 [Phytophthora rubi]KAE9341529.1 hypothetical protein PR003_g9946 [Phytophthora rubi]